MNTQNLMWMAWSYDRTGRALRTDLTDTDHSADDGRAHVQRMSPALPAAMPGRRREIAGRSREHTDIIYYGDGVEYDRTEDVRYAPT